MIRPLAMWRKMPLFQQTIAEYTCTKRCGYHRSVAGANLARFDLTVAVVAALPLWLYLLCSSWRFPWYSLISVLAGELLLLILAGFLHSIFLAPFTTGGAGICKKCGAPMFLAGRHFNPLGSTKPHWSDISVLVIFAAGNVCVWANVLTT